IPVRYAMTSPSNARSRSRASASASSVSSSGAATTQAMATSPPADVDLALMQEPPFGFVVPHDELRRARLGEHDGDEADDDDGRHHDGQDHGFLRHTDPSRRENTRSGGRVASQDALPSGMRPRPPNRVPRRQ